MPNCRSPRTLKWVLRGLLVVSSVTAWERSSRNACAYTPESPEVRAMVDRAYRYMEAAQQEPELGGDSLIGLVFVKDGKGERHPVVSRTAKRAVAAARAGTVLDSQSNALYSAGLTAIFLDGPVTASVDSAGIPGYRTRIDLEGEVTIDAVVQAFALPYGDLLAGQARWRGSLRVAS